MAHRITQEQEQAQDRGRREMLLREAALAAALLAVWGRARNPREIESGVLRAVIAGRASTRIIASQSAIAQIRAAGVPVPTIVAPGAAEEIARASAAARGAAETWAGHAADAAAEGATASEATAAARERSLWKVRQISVTETAESYSLEVDRIAGEVNRVHRVLWKIWDAVLDRRTCPVCGSAHGAAVPADQRFPQGEPGAVHPFCRCQTVLVTREQVDREVAGGVRPGPVLVSIPGGNGKPGSAPQPERTAASRPAFVVVPGPMTAEPAPPSERRQLTRPRRIDVVPLPGTPAGDRRLKPATFRPGRPPTKEEVAARKRARREAEFLAAQRAAAERRRAIIASSY